MMADISILNWFIQSFMRSKQHVYEYSFIGIHKQK